MADGEHSTLAEAIVDDIRDGIASAVGVIPQVAESIKFAIIRRAQAGQGESGFVPYSEKWARRRRKAGLSTSPVDLTFDGLMFDSMKVMGRGDTPLSIDPRGTGSRLRGARGRWVAAGEIDPIIIGWSAGKQARKAYAHQYGTGRVPARPFMGFTEEDALLLDREMGLSFDSGMSTKTKHFAFEFRVM